MKYVAPLACMALAALAPMAAAQQENPRVVVAGTDAAWAAKKIDLDVRDISVLDAIKQILEKADLSEYEIAPEVAEIAKDRKVTLVFRDIRANDALASVCRLAGGVAMSETSNGKTKISIIKRNAAQARVFTLGTPWPGRNSPQFEAQIQEAIAQANRAVSRYTFSVGSGFGLDKALAEKRVNIDVRKKDVRDVLKDLLNKADVGIALEDDVPDTKHSFTFENVPLSVALDVVCRSVDIGWRAEKQGGKTVIRIGKKYNARRRAFQSAPGSSNAFSGEGEFSLFGKDAFPRFERFGIETEKTPEEIAPGADEDDELSFTVEVDS